LINSGTYGRKRSELKEFAAILIYKAILLFYHNYFLNDFLHVYLSREGISVQKELVRERERERVS
jgi:hypothetical protein